MSFPKGQTSRLRSQDVTRTNSHGFEWDPHWNVRNDNVQRSILDRYVLFAHLYRQINAEPQRLPLTDLECLRQCYLQGWPQPSRSIALELRLQESCQLSHDQRIATGVSQVGGRESETVDFHDHADIPVWSYAEDGAADPALISRDMSALQYIM